MNTKYIKMIGIFIIINITIHATAQVDKKDIASLDTILKTSLYKTILTIDIDGVVSRQDNNGNTFVYNIKDVKNVEYVFDGFHNAVITLKEGKTVKGVLGGKESQSGLNVIAFNKEDDCVAAIEKLRNMVVK
jgi:hypothetical protein